MSNLKIIAGNWKMNGSVADGKELMKGIRSGATAQDFQAVKVIVCPPAILVPAVREDAGEFIAVGGQNCHHETAGAHTGHISAEMLKDAGCKYVIVGHSERRQNDGQTNADVAKSAQAAKRAGLEPIICIGETEDIRNKGTHIKDVITQLSESLPADFKANDFMVAYEPVWAIGTGKTAENSDIVEMHAALRQMLESGFGSDGADIAILYGGSVKPGNAKDILSIDNVGGVLVGGASLKADDFVNIIKAGA